MWIASSVPHGIMPQPMRPLPSLDADAIRAGVPIADMLDAVEAAYRDVAAGRDRSPMRSRVELPNGDLLLMPGVREGQRWRIPCLDPLDALNAVLPGNGPDMHYLDAEVLPGTHDLDWRGQTVPCLIIQYRGDEREGRTWLRADDGLVLRQEMKHRGDHWVMQRDRE